MHKKSVKKEPTTNQFGVILENIDDKLKLVLEGHAALDVKIDKVHNELTVFKKDTDDKFQLVLEGHAALNNKLDFFKTEVDYKFDIVFEELHIIRNDLKEKVGRDEFILLEKRVAWLEQAQDKWLLYHANLTFLIKNL